MIYGVPRFSALFCDVCQLQLVAQPKKKEHSKAYYMDIVLCAAV